MSRIAPLWRRLLVCRWSIVHRLSAAMTGPRWVIEYPAAFYEAFRRLGLLNRFS